MSSSTGLSVSMELLATTANEAAVPLLIWALDSPYEPIRHGAFNALLSRSNRQGYRELLARLHRFPYGWLERLREYGDRLRPVLREAILSEDPQVRLNGCQAAIWLGQYELIPSLLTALEQRAVSESGPILAALYDLVEQVRHPASSCRPDDRDWPTCRNQVLAALEGSLERWPYHRRPEVLELFVHLAPRDHPLLRQILQSPHHPLHFPMVNVLMKSRSPAVKEFLLGAVEDSDLPVGVVSVFSRRSDPKFVRHWLRKIARSQSPVLAENLKRLRNLSWLREGGISIGGLDSWAELGLVRVAVLSSISRNVAFRVIEHMLRRGKPAARRAAAEALAHFQGAAANALAQQMLDDPDPYVQAAIIPHLRHRGIPGLFPRLVALLDSPHAVVRQAVRKTLQEFNFKRYLRTFDLLEESARRQTGLLVKKIDPETIPLLQQELQSPIRSRRLRAIAISRSIDAVEPLETILIRLAQEDEDPQVRQEAETLLASRGIRLHPTPLPQKSLPEAARSPKAKLEPNKQRNPSGDLLLQYRNALEDPRG